MDKKVQTLNSNQRPTDLSETGSMTVVLVTFENFQKISLHQKNRDELSAAQEGANRGSEVNHGTVKIVYCWNTCIIRTQNETLGPLTLTLDLEPKP